MRLFKGQKGSEVVYYENPLDAINFWVEQEASRLHFVDLDGAWGSNINRALLMEMIEKASSKVKVQIGGGIRSVKDAIELIELGVDRIVLGTLAVNHPEKIKELVSILPTGSIIIAIDYRQNKIAIHGWTKITKENPFAFAKKMLRLGANYVLFSSIEADGTLTGPDIQNIKMMVKIVGEDHLFIAGGIRNEKDIKKLNNLGVAGVIIGKAFYEHQIPTSIIKKFS